MARRTLALVTVTAAALAALGGAVPASAAPNVPATYPTTLPPESLNRGQVLHAGQVLASGEGQGIALTMQTDGNLVLSVVSARRVLWSTHTTGANNYVTFQSDNNVVLRSAAGVALWSSGTAGSDAGTFIVTPEGNAIVADARHALWTSPNAPAAGNGIVIDVLVSPNGHYRALMQTDGNFVVSSAQTGALWSTGTAGHPGAFLESQLGDGNLVIYGPKALWTSHTSGPTQTTLEMQDDGNLVLYRGFDPEVAVWSSHTAGRP